MASFEVANLSDEAAARNMAAFDNFLKRYRSDPSFRRDLEQHPDTLLSEFGIRIPEGLRLKVVADTDAVMHIVMPSDPNLELSDEALQMIAGGDSASSVSTAGTASTMASLSSVPSTVGTIGTGGTAMSQ